MSFIVSLRYREGDTRELLYQFCIGVFNQVVSALRSTTTKCVRLMSFGWRCWKGQSELKHSCRCRLLHNFLYVATVKRLSVRAKNYVQNVSSIQLCNDKNWSPEWLAWTLRVMEKGVVLVSEIMDFCWTRFFVDWIVNSGTITRDGLCNERKCKRDSWVRNASHRSCRRLRYNKFHAKYISVYGSTTLSPRVGSDYSPLLFLWHFPVSKSPPRWVSSINGPFRFYNLDQSRFLRLRKHPWEKNRLKKKDNCSAPTSAIKQPVTSRLTLRSHPFGLLSTHNWSRHTFGVSFIRREALRIIHP